MKLVPNYKRSLSVRTERMQRRQECLNCGTPLDAGDNFCKHCGQANDGRRLSFSELIAETLANLFSLDSRFYFTLRTLMARPGLIAKDFVEGKRQRFVHPIRFYLSISLVFFLLQGLINRIEKSGDVPASATAVEAVASQKDAPDVREVIDSLAADSTLDPIILETLQDNLDQEEEEGSITVHFDEDTGTKWTVDTTGRSNFSKIAAFIEEHRDVPYRDGLDSLGLKETFWNKWSYVQYRKFRNSDKKSLGEFYLGKLPLTIFLFMPIFGFIFVPLYWRRNFHYIDHLVFIFYHQAYFFLMLLFAMIADTIWKTSAFTGVAVLYFLLYLFFAFKRFYQQSYGKTLVKFTLIQMSLFLMSVIFIILMSVVLFIFYQ